MTMQTTPSGQSFWRRLFRRPYTKPGWWAITLAAIFVLLLIINAFLFTSATVVVPWRQVVLPIYAITMITCALAAGILGLIAIIRQHENSWLVWLSMLLGLFILFLLVGEFLFPH